MIWIPIIAVLTALMGIVYLRGKGDGFIAGYNTASPEQKRRVIIERLRLLVAIFHFGIAALFFLFFLKNSDLAATIFFSSLTVLAIVVIVLANTWAKRR